MISSLTAHLLVAFIATIGFFLYQLYAKHVKERANANQNKNLAKNGPIEHHEINLANISKNK